MLNHQEVSVKTGEENEDVLLKLKAMLYRFDREGGEWKDRRVGTLKLLQHKETSKVRLVMRQDKVFLICANHLVLPTIKVRVHHENENACVWYAADFAVGELKLEIFCIRFGSLENCKQFRDKIEEITKSLTNEDEDSGAQVAPIVKRRRVSVWTVLLQLKGELYRFDGECFEWKDKVVGTVMLLRHKETGKVLLVMKQNKPFKLRAKHFVLPTIKVQEHLKNEKGCVWYATDFADGKPKGEIFYICFASLKNCRQFRDKIEEITESLANEDEDTGVQVAPIYKRQGVSVATGEENEDVLLKLTGELYRFDKERVQWKDRGLGTVKLLRHKETSKVRLVMIQDNTFKTCANHLVLPTIKVQVHHDSDKMCVWHAADFAVGEPKVEIFCLRFASLENCKLFRDKIEEITKSLANEYENTGVQVAPIIKCQGVSVATGEENEYVLLKLKAMLYRFDREGGEWKDRRVGTLKLLRHKESDKVRLVMRQDKVFLICANHLVLPTIKVRVHHENENACVWYAADFAVGELKLEFFCIRFGSLENCKLFRDKIEEITKLQQKKIEGDH